MKEGTVMIANIFHEVSGRYPDMITVCGKTIEELKGNALKAVESRGWAYDDCWSQIYENKDEH